MMCDKMKMFQTLFGQRTTFCGSLTFQSVPLKSNFKSRPATDKQMSLQCLSRFFWFYLEAILFKDRNFIYNYCNLFVTGNIAREIFQ